MSLRASTNRYLQNTLLTLAAVIFATPSLIASDNPELWDFYPSAIGFAHFDGSDEVIAADIVSWENYAAGAATLNGQSFQLQVTDAVSEAFWILTEGNPITLKATTDWTWQVLFQESFMTGNCEFTFDQSLGIRKLVGEEGYTLAQREKLSWTDDTGSCPDILRRYIQGTSDQLVMPAHLNDWQSLGGPGLLADTGRFEMRLWHDLRRSRRLLPFDLTAEAGADPFTAIMGALEPGEARFTLLFERLGPFVFNDKFDQQNGTP